MPDETVKDFNFLDDISGDILYEFLETKMPILLNEFERAIKEGAPLELFTDRIEKSIKAPISVRNSFKRALIWKRNQILRVN